MPPCASRCGSSPCARPAIPTSCSACSIAMPTSACSEPPTRPLHYVLADNLEELPPETRRGRRSARLGRGPARRARRAAGARGRILQAYGRKRRRGRAASTGSAASRPSKTRPWARRSGRSGSSSRGRSTRVMVSYLTRSLEQARQQKKNLLFFQIDSPGGIETAGDDLADKIAAIKDMKTVAYIDDRATGVAAPVAPGLPRHRLQEVGAHGRRPPDDHRPERPTSMT